jgi:pimeloyl-ACP methyl ester carboxylesterase
MERALSGNSFEKQFQNKESFRFRDGRIKVVDITPEILTDEVPILVIPGWTENYDTYKKGLELIYKSGRRVISFDYSRRGGRVPKQDSHPQSELRKAHQVLQVLREKQIHQADVIAHSEGAISALLATGLKPWAFRNVVLDRPMGMTGGENKLGLFTRWLRNMSRERSLRSDDPADTVGKSQVLKRTAKYIMKNPIRAAGESLRMTNFDVTPFLSDASEHGVMFSIIAGRDDLMSPGGRIVSHAEKLGKPLPAETYMVPGTHNSISIQPERYMAFALSVLSGLQAKRASVNR